MIPAAMTSPLFTALIGLCLGSFLHAIAHRISFEKPVLRARSHCPNCDALIAWYHNIPVLSWLLLGGRCCTCQSIISWIYPFTELVTAIGLTLIWHYMPLPSAWSGVVYTVFLAALIVATTSDLHTMTIPQIASLWIAPVGIVTAGLGFLHISLLQSILGTITGYASLWLVNFVFKKIRGIDGIGEGDMELFCLIGAFTGLLGLWHTLLIASVTGSIVGGITRLIKKKTRLDDANTMIPFGPFLALGAFCHLMFSGLLQLMLNLL